MRFRVYVWHLFVFVSLLFAHDYPHRLDSRFTDRNGDLLADTPLDPTHHIDPPELIFAYPPHENPDIYRRAWRGFLDYLERQTGKKVRFFPYQTNQAQLEAMRYGRLHIAGFNTGSVPDAVNYAGFHPIAVMADSKGDYGYHMEILTYKGSGITRIEQIKGETVTFTSPSSHSGDKAARYILAQRFHLEAGYDYDVRYSGSHAHSLKGLAAHRYKVVAVASSVKQRMIARGKLHASQLVTLYRSALFPTTAYGYVYNLTPRLAQAVRRAFLTYPWYKPDGEPTALKTMFNTHDRFVPIDYKNLWKTVRAIKARLETRPSQESYSGNTIRNRTP